MKYKVGDRVRIGKFNTNFPDKKQWQGKVMTIWAIEREQGTLDSYVMKEDNAKNSWYEEMIEGLAEPEPTMTEILQLAINTYGEDEQIRMVNEEMAELTVALSKYHRNPSEDTMRAVIEEIADVRIMIGQAAIMFGSGNVLAAEERKAKRLYDRLKEEQAVEVVSGKHKINGETYTWINPDKVKVEIGGIAIADTKKGHTPIIVVSTWMEKLKDVKHHRKIVCGGGLNDE